MPSAQTTWVRFPVGEQKKKIYFLAAFQCFGGHCKPSVQSTKSLSSSCFLLLIYQLKIKITFTFQLIYKNRQIKRKYNLEEVKAILYHQMKIEEHMAKTNEREIQLDQTWGSFLRNHQLQNSKEEGQSVFNIYILLYQVCRNE